MAVWITDVSGADRWSSEVHLPGGGRILWSFWAAQRRALIVVAQDQSTPRVFSVDPATSQATELTRGGDRLVMSLASPVNGYRFSRFRIRREGQALDLTPEGEFVPVADAQDLCSGGACGGNSLRFIQRGQEQRYGSGPPGVENLLVVNAADRRQGTALMSVASEGRAFFLSSVERDRLGLLSVSLATGKTETLAEGESDILSVVLHPTTLMPEFVEFDDRSRVVKALSDEGRRHLAALRRLGHSEPRIVDRAPGDRYWLVAFPDAPYTARLMIYDASQQRLRAIRPVGTRYRGSVTWTTSRDVVRSVGGIEVPFLVFTPLSCGDRTCPLVVRLHGGPAVRDSGEVSPEDQTLLGAGFALLHINYRGSRGFGKQYELLDRKQWFGAIEEDVARSLEKALRLPGLDGDRVAFTGTSFSAFLALNLLGKAHSARCAVVDSGFYDLPEFVRTSIAKTQGNTDLIERAGDPRIDAERQAMEAASPIGRSLAFAKTPILLFHGAKDTTVDVSQARAFAARLQAHANPLTYVELADEGHGLTGARQVVIDKTTTFLAACLRPAQGLSSSRPRRSSEAPDSPR
ncbi:alpha/beta hydrolase family protein [Roseateles chitinivorans]|uniref:alpha/beta hydrolase family protein n=1 Tax=Roseateles chitinivorans TaxID=2917965 RepID=UPI003D6775D4